MRKVRVLREPLAPADLKRMARGGYLKVVIPVDFNELARCGDLNAYVEARILNQDCRGFLANISYRIVGFTAGKNEAGSILLEVCANVENVR
jgi:hypothetical protein